VNICYESTGVKTHSDQLAGNSELPLGTGLLIIGGRAGGRRVGRTPVKRRKRDPGSAGDGEELPY